MHKEFVCLSELCSSLIIEASYGTPQNFTGEIVPGYKARKALLTLNPAKALVKAQDIALAKGLSLKIFDSYRPAKAVAFFQEWAQREENNPEIKAKYYPDFSRKELFEQGYIAKRSSHSRGSAVDLTLVELSSGIDLDMGSAFDYFDSLSNTDSPLVTSLQKENRQLLRALMEAQGFKNYSQEWWHYSYENESFPNEYFDFDIE